MKQSVEILVINKLWLTYYLWQGKSYDTLLKIGNQASHKRNKITNISSQHYLMWQYNWQNQHLLCWTVGQWSCFWAFHHTGNICWKLSSKVIFRTSTMTQLFEYHWINSSSFRSNITSSQIKSVFSRFYLSKEYWLNLHEPGNLFMLKKKKYLFKPQP